MYTENLGISFAQHRLAPAIEELESECLTGEWTVYPWAIAIAMMSVFGIFILELVAFRLGVAYMDRLGIDVHDTHGPGVAHVRTSVDRSD